MYLHIILLPLLVASVDGSAAHNSNALDFSIDSKTIASFPYSGMSLSIWESQANTTTPTGRQFYVMPISEFLPNSTLCEYNPFTGLNTVSFDIELWNEHVQTAAIDRLGSMGINTSPPQVQPLPFYQVSRVGPPSAETAESPHSSGMD